MHLSFLSDATLSDLFDDAGRQDPRRPAARQHLEGVLRGLVFVAALAAPVALTFAPAAFGHPGDGASHVESPPNHCPSC